MRNTGLTPGATSRRKRILRLRICRCSAQNDSQKEKPSDYLCRPEQAAGAPKDSRPLCPHRYPVRSRKRAANSPMSLRGAKRRGNPFPGCEDFLQQQAIGLTVFFLLYLLPVRKCHAAAPALRTLRRGDPEPGVKRGPQRTASRQANPAPETAQPIPPFPKVS